MNNDWTPIDFISVMLNLQTRLKTRVSWLDKGQKEIMHNMMEDIIKEFWAIEKLEIFEKCPCIGSYAQPCKECVK